jgi:hypothetical protein
MKKYFVTLAVTVSVCTQVALANNLDPLPVAAKNDKVNSRILCSFEKNFAGATYIQWEKLKGKALTQAVFHYNKERYIAFFDNDGKLVATGRFISINQVPLLVKLTVDRNYAAYNLVQVVELTQNDETSYIVTFDNDRIKFDTQIYSDGGAHIIKKEKKNFVAGL